MIFFNKEKHNPVNAVFYAILIALVIMLHQRWITFIYVGRYLMFQDETVLCMLSFRTYFHLSFDRNCSQRNGLLN